MDRKKHFQSTYFKWGATAFLVIALSIVFFFMVYRYEGLQRGLAVIGSILAPFVYGLVMAYLVYPLYNVCVRAFSRVHWLKIRGKDRGETIARILATIIAIIAILGVIIALLWMIIPQLVNSVSLIAQEMPGYVRNMVAFLQERADHLPAAFTTQLETVLSDVSGNFIAWVEDTLLPQYDSILLTISESIRSIVTMLLNFFIGLVICTYFLNRKEIFLAQAKKLIAAVCTEEHSRGILQGAAYTNKVFWGFISGKLIDSLVIGVLCFICMNIFRWPYAVLISVLIGVTNIIPFFGPFIGAIPSALLMLMVSPKLCLLFIIFVLVLQQVDGNIIGPRILGETTGLSSFWVMFAILAGGTLFGVLGMVLGVPVFAVLYAYICYLINRRLEKKGLSTSLWAYVSPALPRHQERDAGQAGEED